MNDQLVVRQRQTKYCHAIKQVLSASGHLTNAELLRELQKAYPDVSATTVHRATTRLANRGEIGIAPASIDGSMRYDANLIPHDHFLCNSCGILRDTDVRGDILPVLEASIGGCSISGRLTISGICKNCLIISQGRNL
jgi:Fur family transcriptional regulator, peroxide stress response regulator